MKNHKIGIQLAIVCVTGNGPGQSACL